MNGTFMQQTLLLVLLIAAAAAAVIYFLVRLIRALESRRNAKCGKCSEDCSGSNDLTDQSVK
ncbi:FeoB-associated Cys-rich membrane protein [Hornefia butyriciproducens]|uniref:FeoB-associated Cys-rich membrane protein n=1 Tax=Hornefia butyriciproducens TaxID=2652293 RepID=A0A6L5Y7G3_9FIRM|nr:FeoB-associated Cys-rich membrane protein [Hornefia butyriciproducens]MCI7326584.1 FeoB-associated Cys-rich membrane protein [Clostridiales bacterium]MDY2991587.1 FeoB-associated Cys-rich membrane protein [Hornefia butyriciproducens]MST52425.1 FeoB-associated Cys-rich membrane protein [Hornefia butyriciproducens]